MGFWERVVRRNYTTPAGEERTIEVRATVTPPSSSPPPDYESPYLSSDRFDALLVPDARGLPPLHFALHEGAWWLAEDTTGKLVNVANRHLRGLGVWSCRVRGDAYAEGELRIGVVELVREPENPYDSNAVAIYQDGAQVGYWNKGMARGLARVLDDGEELQAVGISDDPPKVVAGDPGVIEHLCRRMPRAR